MATAWIFRHGQAQMDGQLSPHGVAQAEAIGFELSQLTPLPLVSSPATRCRATLGVLAELWGARVIEDRRWASGGTPAEAAEALSELLLIGGVACSHNDVLPDLVALVVERYGLPPVPGLGPPASRWRFDGAAGTITAVQFRAGF